MAKVGRPKKIEKMQPWERKEHERKEAMKHLTAEQLQAINETRETLGKFVDQWTETFDIYDPDVPRLLQSAFWALSGQFPRD
jgi:hypothetical protein